VLKYITGLIRCKKVWVKPKHAKCLIWDARTGKPLHCVIDHKDIGELYTPFQKLNIYVLIHLFFYGKPTILNYYELYIRQVHPRVVITMTDCSKVFYQLKKRLPKITFIAVQSSWRGEKIFDDINEKLKCDYYLAFNNEWGKRIKKLINCKVITTGSYICNALLGKQKRIKQKKKQLLFISEFRKESNISQLLIKHDGLRASWDDLYSLEKLILPILHEFCLEHKIKLNIIGAKPLNHTEELHFFKKVLPQKGWVFSPRTTWFSSYKKIISSDFVVFINSTLGYESFVSGKRIACICARGRWIAAFNDRVFGWPNILPTKGFCWTDSSSPKEISRVINNLLMKTNLETSKKLKHIANKVMEFDRGNQKLIKLLHEKGLATKSDFTKIVPYESA